jgi:hypothetical protein
LTTLVGLINLITYHAQHKKRLLHQHATAIHMNHV